MGYVQQDMARFAVSGEDHGDLARRLQDVQSTAEEHVEAWHAGRPARRTRREGELAGKHFVVVLLHHVFGPLLQIGVADVADALGGLFSRDAGLIVRNVRMGRVLPDWFWRARDRKKCT